MLYFILYKYPNGAVHAVYEENVRTAPPECGVCSTPLMLKQKGKNRHRF